MAHNYIRLEWKVQDSPSHRIYPGYISYVGHYPPKAVFNSAGTLERFGKHRDQAGDLGKAILERCRPKE